MTFNVVDYGAIGDGNVANAAVNTTALLEALADAANAVTPGAIYIPASSGFVINNGQVKLTNPNMKIYGDASMGASSGPTSIIIGHGPGSTIEIDAPGCVIDGITFRPNAAGEQKDNDAFLLTTASPTTFRDLFLWSPNIGISLQLPTGSAGEFWINDVLVEGVTVYAGIVANIGNAAICLRHVIMGGADPQPPYGVLVTSAGELIMTDGCDIINMGSCLAIMPGLNGVKGQWVAAVLISNCLFDGGNGLGCVYVSPRTDGFVSTVHFTNVWTSTANNGLGQWNTNGYTFDGTQAKPAALPPIQDVSLVNCIGKGFVNHCGMYAKGVQGLSSIGGTFGANYQGIEIDTGCSSVVLIGNRCGNYTPPPVMPGSGLSGGNTQYGILLAPVPFLIDIGNMCAGNGLGGVKNLSPTSIGQVSGLNLP